MCFIERKMVSTATNILSARLGAVLSTIISRFFASIKAGQIQNEADLNEILYVKKKIKVEFRCCFLFSQCPPILSPFLTFYLSVLRSASFFFRKKMLILCWLFLCNWTSLYDSTQCNRAQLTLLLTADTICKFLFNSDFCLAQHESKRGNITWEWEKMCHQVSLLTRRTTQSNSRKTTLNYSKWK